MLVKFLLWVQTQWEVFVQLDINVEMALSRLILAHWVLISHSLVKILASLVQLVNIVMNLQLIAKF